MNKFPVPLLRQLLGCMRDGLSIRVTAQKLGIPKSTVSFLFQMVLSHGEAKVAQSIQLPDTQLLETFYPPTTKKGRCGHFLGLFYDTRTPKIVCINSRKT